ncbi:MAG: HD domain-containing protein [Candidatus Zixiibacteriota bacterium]|nr:MAG: HD domain-containing protein [candidate division Zixibacteria bacterium]
MRHLVQEARRQGLPLYLVGGAVRSRLLNPEADIDNADLLILGRAGDFAAAAAAALKRPAVRLNPQFDTVLIPDRSVEFEISGPRGLLRTPPDQVSLPADPLERDLALRDFTVNALAQPLSPRRGALVDPTGGQADLEKRLLRTPLPAAITLREDPLRILRAARLAAQWHFSLDRELLEAMHAERARVRECAAERRTAELLKILQTEKPSIGLKLLFITGVLEAAYPEIAALSMAQDRKPRHKDVFEHTLKVVDTVAQAGASLETRLAALLHDIGKPATRHFDPQAGWTFHGHEVLGERLVKRLGREWRLPAHTVEKTSRLVRLHMRPINLTDEEVTDSAVRRLRVQAGDDVDELLTLCRADVTSSDPHKVRRYLKNFEKVVEHIRSVDEKDQLRAFQSPVRGETIMAETGLEPGPQVGRLKKMIEDAILDGAIPNEYEAALEYLRKIKDSVLQDASS